MSISNRDNTLRGARNLGRLDNRSRRINGYVGSRDLVDFAKFTLGDVRELVLSIGRIANRASSAQVTLRNAQGAVIRSFNTGRQNITFRSEFAPGTYFIGVRRLRGEVNYRITAAARPAGPSGPGGPGIPSEPGDRLDTARNIGVLAGTYTDSEFVGTTDPADIYRFTLNDVANLQARVTGTSANTRVELIRDLNGNGLIDSGEVIASGTNFGAPFLSSVTQDLPQGTYFLRITPTNSNSSTQYRLELVATPFGGLPSNPGSTIPTAFNLGAFSGTFIGKEYVGSLDEADFYRVTLNDISNIQASVRATSANTRIQLIRDLNNNGLVDNGEIVASDTNFSSQFLSSINQDVPPGTYFIKVEPRSPGQSTLYELNLVATPFGGTLPADPGNTLSTARDIGVLSGTFTAREHVGFLDSDDFYRFTLGSPATLQFRVTGSSANTRIQLIQDINGNGIIDSGETIATDTNFSSTFLSTITQSLAAGTYFARVSPRNTDVSTNYSISLVV